MSEEALEAASTGPSGAADGNRELRASELAQALAALVPAISEKAAQDLKRLLGRTLTMPSPSELREARLGLLIDLVVELQGEVPSIELYNLSRAASLAERDENWPAHTTLIRAYGSTWLAAVKAAMRVAFEGSNHRVSKDNHSRQFKPAYERPEYIDAVRKCAEAIGATPTLLEYTDWTILMRRGARAAGKPEPRLPGREAVLQLWGSWLRLIRAAGLDQV
jgi:hypothetical protein